MMRVNTGVLLTLFLATVATGTASGQSLYVYPNQGQSATQQDRDQGECNSWAVRNTGFDPMSAPANTYAQERSGGVVRGGARGAALGAVAGAIAGDAGKGAAIGAATGGLFGGMRQRSGRRQDQQAQQQQAAQNAQMRDAYNRAFAACMAGKGYTVR